VEVRALSDELDTFELLDDEMEGQAIDEARTCPLFRQIRNPPPQPAQGLVLESDPRAGVAQLGNARVEQPAVVVKQAELGNRRNLPGQNLVDVPVDAPPAEDAMVVEQQYGAVLTVADLGACPTCDTIYVVRPKVLNEVYCNTCRKSVPRRGPRRRRLARGSMGLIRAAQRQFPERLLGPNNALARQQVYVYMLREAQRLHWSISAQTDLPVLAALAMLPSKVDVEANRISRSEIADLMRSDYFHSMNSKPAKTYWDWLVSLKRWLQFRL